jgi:hypothetical protein
MTACQQKKQTRDAPAEVSTEITTNVMTPLDISNLNIDALDLNQNINNFSLQDLRILRNLAYAKYGYLFIKAELRGYFTANTDWYEDRMMKRWEAEEENPKIAPIKLTEEETAFMERIDKRIAELKKEDYVEVEGNKVANPNNIVNLFQFRNLSSEFTQKLYRNNAVIAPSKNIQLFHIYEENDYHEIPNFITTDLMLQAFHMYFSYTLKFLEQEKFIPAIQELSYALYQLSMKEANASEGEMKDIALYNAVFYAIPYYLLSGKKVEIPVEYKALYEEELQHIAGKQDVSSRFLDFDGFSYSQFKPRGHYTRKEALSRYFMAMQWLQLAPYCRENEQQLKDAVFVAALLNSAASSNGKSLMELYKSVFEPVVFLVGEPDNLSVMDIAEYLNKEKIRTTTAALQGETIEQVNRLLIETAKTRNRIASQIKLNCHDKINFMPARYLVDNEIIQELVDIQANAKRAYPKGLDVFATFGSKPAMDILLNIYHDDKEWDKYLPNLKTLQNKFNKYDEWNASVYNKWIESLLTLQHTDKSCPVFMQLPSWDVKNLNTALASWTDLKHDAILYSEQPVASECGGDGPPDPITVGYVEPNIAFWEKLGELLTLTDKLLTRNNLMTDELKSRTEQLTDKVKFLLAVSKKELKKTKLTEAEYNTIAYFGANIEYFTLSVIDPDITPDRWGLVEGPDKSIAVVADVFTRNINGCNKNGVLLEAVGNANNLFVVVEIEGNLYLTKGAVFSYYEFVNSSRLTDEEWQEMLEKNKAPRIPEWMDIITVNIAPGDNERITYSSGCLKRLCRCV